VVGAFGPLSLVYERRKFIMIKKTIAYTDYEGVERKEDFFFNLSKPELIEMQTSVEGGLEKKIEKISKEQDIGKIVEVIKDIICRSYGVKSDDGKRFIKNKEVLDDFIQSEAYSELFMELATDADAAAAFINGILPAGLAEELKKIEGSNLKLVESSDNN
jgi:hypothetical protein